MDFFSRRPDGLRQASARRDGMRTSGKAGMENRHEDREDPAAQSVEYRDDIEAALNRAMDRRARQG
jgi:hypothetical protein